MGLVKPYPNAVFHVPGAAFTKSQFSPGATVRRTGQNDNVFSSGLYSGLNDSYPTAWSTSGVAVGPAGNLLFNNDANGGMLQNVIVSNKGSATTYIGYNSETPNAASGFPLASGESYSFNNVRITELWAITTAGSGFISAQGFYNRQYLNKFA